MQQVLRIDRKLIDRDQKRNTTQSWPEWKKQGITSYTYSINTSIEAINKVIEAHEAGINKDNE